MLATLFSTAVYVRVKRNQFLVKHLASGVSVNVAAQSPFTSTRLLIGQFLAAQETLKHALSQVVKKRFLPSMPQVVVHPLEMIDGGLSEIEDRILREVVLGAGATKVVVWIGHELSDAEVEEKLNG